MKLRLIGTVLTIGLTGLAVHPSAAQHFDWVQSIGGLGLDVGRDVTTDAEGNVIMVGSFSGSTQIADTVLSGQGLLEGFLAKFTPNGEMLWARVISGPGEDMVRGVLAEEDGSIYVVGHFTDSVTFDVAETDTAAARSEGGTDIFVAKYRSDGSFVWHLTGGGRNDDTATDIARYRWSGKLYVSGGFQDRARFGASAVLSRGYSDAFLMKIDAEGNVHWVRHGGGTEHDVAAAVAVDLTNEAIYMTGDFYQQATFGDTELQAVGSSDMFLARYDADGNLLWVQANGGTNVDVATDIGVDLNNMVYVCGYYQLTTLFQPHAATALGYNDVFLAQFTPQGTCNWLRSAGSNALDNCLGMAVDWDGTTYLTGMFEDQIHAGGLVQTGDGYDVFVLSYFSDGTARYIRTAGAANADFGMALCLGADNSLFVTGYYFFYADFDGITIGNAENGDAFLARMTDILSVEELPYRPSDGLSYDDARREFRSQDGCSGIWTLTDLQGRTAAVPQVGETLRLPYLAPGMYHVSLQTGHARFARKFIIVQ